MTGSQSFEARIVSLKLLVTHLEFDRDRLAAAAADPALLATDVAEALGKTPIPAKWHRATQEQLLSCLHEGGLLGPDEFSRRSSACRLVSRLAWA